MNQHEYRVAKMAQTLGVNRSSYYSYSNPVKSIRQKQEQYLMPRIKNIFENSRQEYGTRRIKKVLHTEGITISRCRVGKLMNKLNLCSKARRRFKVTTKQSSRPYYVAPNLLKQNFTTGRPNQAWVTDITYIPTQEGWLYAATVLDLFSRKIVGLAMSQRMTTDLVLRSVGQAISHRKPPPGLIIHSDRGSQYTSKAYHALTKQHKVELSMSSTGNCYDNAVAESFFHTLKLATVHNEKFETRNQATRVIFEYIEVFYNRQRMHSALGYLTPDQFEHFWLNNGFVPSESVQ